MKIVRPASLACLLATGAVASVAIAAAASLAVVSQKNSTFSVGAITIARGEVVEFYNADSYLHQVYVDAAVFKFESEGQAAGTSVDIRFPDAGSFEVRCEIHPKMLLRVTVH